ncbi:MAG: hypothetical protein O3C21_12665 [Verrucomicrobia bacterium]|nr:hypothetical protein [Verrucomicrobiota bacterium]
MKPNLAWIVFLVGAAYLLISFEASQNGSIHLNFLEPLAGIGAAALLFKSARRPLLLIAGYWLAIVGSVMVSSELAALLNIDPHAATSSDAYWVIVPIGNVALGMWILLCCGRTRNINTEQG